jgi:hypothetical protein
MILLSGKVVVNRPKHEQRVVCKNNSNDNWQENRMKNGEKEWMSL